MCKPVEPLFVLHEYEELQKELLILLSKMDKDDWFKPTAAAGWTVKDMTAHLLETDIRRLSIQRDHLVLPEIPILDYSGLVAYLDRLNAEWIQVSRRFSPEILVYFLRLINHQVVELFSGLDPFDEAVFAVAWSGEEKSFNWYDIAREYTEKWMHQQHIREALNRPGLFNRFWLFPALDTFLRGLPHLFQDVAAPIDTTIGISIEGDAGAVWSLIKLESRWELYTGCPSNVAARVIIDQDTAWRLFTKGISPDEAFHHSKYEGDLSYARQVLNLVAMMG